MLASGCWANTAVVSYIWILVISIYWTLLLPTFPSDNQVKPCRLQFPDYLVLPANLAAAPSAVLPIPGPAPISREPQSASGEDRLDQYMPAPCLHQATRQTNQQLVVPKSSIYLISPLPTLLKASRTTTIPSLPYPPGKPNSKESCPIPAHPNLRSSTSLLDGFRGHLGKTCEISTCQAPAGTRLLGNTAVMSYAGLPVASIYCTSCLCAFPEAHSSQGPPGPRANTAALNYVWPLHPPFT